MGNVLASSEATGGGTYNFSYGYNLAGALTSEGYPSGRTITTGYDGANRATTVAGRLNGGAQTNYVTSVSYWPHGAPESFVYGNNLYGANYFNSRLQISGITAAVGGSPYEYEFLEYPIQYGSTNNNGNVLSIAEGIGNQVAWGGLTWFTQSFTYDGVNRLETATDTTGSTVNWSRTFSYDQYGNAWVPAASGVGYGVSTPEWNVYNTKNQVSSSPYDAAGNISALPPGYTFVYDAENRITAETNSGGLSANYYYDGMGDRVEKVLSNGQAIVSVYDAFGNLAEEYSPATTWSKDFVPFNGQTVAIENATANPCTTCCLSYDYLGTPRLVTDANANVKGVTIIFRSGTRFRAAWRAAARSSGRMSIT